MSRRMGLAFGVFSLLSGAFAATGQGVWWLLLWPATSWAVIATGYLGAGARVVGKRPDGSLPWGSTLLLLPHLALTYLGWLAVKLTPEAAHDEVGPGVFLGRRPWLRDLPSSVGLVVDMTAELPPAPGVIAGRAYRCVPTLDGGTPDEAACERVLGEIGEHPGPVYIHCAYGHGRSAVIAGAALVRRGLATSADEALRMMRAARPRVRMSADQRALMERLARRAVARGDRLPCGR